MTRRRGGSGLVDLLVIAKRLIGVIAVLGVFYLVIPWRLIWAVTSENEVTSDVFTTVMMEWVTGLADNILLIVLLLFIAVLTYGPEVLALVAGPNEPRRPGL